MPAAKAIVRPAVAFRQNPLQLARLYAMPSAVRDRAFEWRLSRVFDVHSLHVLSVIASQCRSDSLDSNLVGAFSLADEPSLFFGRIRRFWISHLHVQICTDSPFFACFSSILEPFFCLNLKMKSDEFFFAKLICTMSHHSML